VLLLALAALLATARLLGESARRFGLPSVLGELVAGVVLGPTILGAINPTAYEWLFVKHASAKVTLDGFVMLSAVLLLLVAGLEVDLSRALRQGRSATAVAFIGMVPPFAMGFAAAWFMPDFLGIGLSVQQYRLAFAVFTGIAVSITALPVIAKILIDLNILKSDMGMLIMSAAVLNDLAGWIGFALVMALLRGSGNVVGTRLLTLAFLGVMIAVARPLVHRLLPYIQAHWSWPGGMIGFILVVTLLCAAATELIGVHAIFGAFIAGVTVGDSSFLRERTRDTIHQFITNIFAPVFFASIGLYVNFATQFHLPVVAVMLALACVGKIGGCYAGARLSKLVHRESLAVGFGMVAQGTMGVILGQLALQEHLIDQKMFVAIVVVALVTSMIAGPGMQRALRRPQPRTLAGLLTDKQFIARLRSGVVRDVISELSGPAADASGLDPLEIFEAAWRREQIMHTGLGDAIAVPHARMAGLKKPVVVVGRSEAGIDFDAADGKPAHIVCLLITARDDPGSQVELLRSVAQSFADPQARQTALAANTYTEFLAAIRLGESGA
jgi:K+:H+ antiporter